MTMREFSKIDLSSRIINPWKALIVRLLGERAIHPAGYLVYIWRGRYYRVE